MRFLEFVRKSLFDYEAISVVLTSTGKIMAKQKEA